jgi:protein gp37
MADLFGEWVPDEWIQEVFAACEKAPQHKYLFLTKNADRYMRIINEGIITVQDNYWFGTTATTPDGDVYKRNQGINTFASIEPILQKFNGCKDLSLLPDWVIIGAETGNRKGKVIPEKAWIDNIVTGCKEACVPVFMKESLRALMGDDFIQQWPEGLEVEVK